MPDYLGPYRLLKLLMSGQSSQIWEVINDRTHERFAVKFLLSEHHKNKEHTNFMKHEFEVGKALKHKHVIEMFELNFENNAPYIVMELYPVPSLKLLVANQGVDGIAKSVKKLILEAATALNFMHQKGWIHRDIKPDNFLSDGKSPVKMIDFALAEKPKSGLMKFFSGKAKIQGTLSYMSPEQIRGETLQFSSDIYSFGCLVYELLSGKPPFVGVNSNELLQRHLKSQPLGLESLNDNLTDEVSKLVKSMLAKKPEDRPESMSHLIVAFKSLRIFRREPK